LITAYIPQVARLIARLMSLELRARISAVSLSWSAEQPHKKRRGRSDALVAS